MLVAGAIGIFQGTLITRLKLPSFVVTLAGLLGWQGVLIFLFDFDKGSTGGVLRVSNDVIYNLVNGNMTVWAGWVHVDRPRRGLRDGHPRAELPVAARGG